MKITIAGAGFSGLTLAYFLVKQGETVEIWERHAHPGGLIQTQKATSGLIETAANGLVNSALVESLFDDVGVRFAPRKPSRKKRYIFRGRPRRLPLTLLEAARAALSFVFHFVIGNHRPKPGESVAQWGRRVGGGPFAKYLLTPALQGVYAGDSEKMSARLVLGRFFGKKEFHKPPSLGGTVAPEGGMGELIEKLGHWLEKHGVKIHYSSQVPATLDGPLVLATSAWEAAEILAHHRLDPELVGQLSQVEALPLATATLFFLEDPNLTRGFGCLFPKEEEFYSLGVLFNSDIFEGRASGRSETWILGGAFHKDVAGKTQEEILWRIASDRKKLFGVEATPVHASVQVWPKALPHYTLDWDSVLSRLHVPDGVYLTGNYLGHLGLSRILEYNRQLAEKIHGA